MRIATEPDTIAGPIAARLRFVRTLSAADHRYRAAKPTVTQELPLLDGLFAEGCVKATLSGCARPRIDELASVGPR